MTETSSPRDLHLRLTPASNEVPRARRAVREWLRSAGVSCDRHTVELLVSELVTNALVHARPPLELRVQALGNASVRIEVVDAAGDQMPILDVSPPDSDGGRGIEIVAALASRWGSERFRSGKLVWAELG